MADTPAPSPEAAELAAERGLDLATVDGTGKDGRVLLGDVEEALAASGPVVLREGSHTFRAPGFLGGAAVTVRAGETVSPWLAAHIPPADRGRFDPAG